MSVILDVFDVWHEGYYIIERKCRRQVVKSSDVYESKCVHSRNFC